MDHENSNSLALNGVTTSSTSISDVKQSLDSDNGYDPAHPTTDSDSLHGNSQTVTDAVARDDDGGGDGGGGGGGGAQRATGGAATPGGGENATIPSAEEQMEIMQSLEAKNEDKKKGDVFYVLSKKWLNRLEAWLTFAKLDDDERERARATAAADPDGAQPPTAPGPIDNDDLLTDVEEETVPDSMRDVELSDTDDDDDDDDGDGDDDGGDGGGGEALATEESTEAVADGQVEQMNVDTNTAMAASDAATTTTTTTTTTTAAAAAAGEVVDAPAVAAAAAERDDGAAAPCAPKRRRDLRSSLFADTDYVALNEECWNTLVEWYGVKPNQTIRRKVVLKPRYYNSTQYDAEVELYRTKLRFWRENPREVAEHAERKAKAAAAAANAADADADADADGAHEDAGDGDNTGTRATKGRKKRKGKTGAKKAPVVVRRTCTLFCSKGDKIRDLLRRVADEFNLQVDDIRLFDYYKCARSTLLADKQDTLSQANLMDGQWVLIEERGLNGKWPKVVDTRDFRESTEPVPKGRCGLQNLGNTCYMNSALQCLSNSVPLREFFTSNNFVKDVNRSNPLGYKGELADHFSELLEHLWSGKYNSVAPRELKSALGTFAPQFAGYQQHDSQELLAFLLDGLHEDLNRVINKPYIETQDSNGRPDEVVAAEHWANHTARNSSVIVDLFQAQLKSTLVCPDCDHVSITFDPFMYLSLPLPKKEKQEFMCVFVPRGGQQAPTRHKFSVKVDATFADVRALVAERTQLRPECLAFCTVWRADVQSKIDDSKFVRDLSSYDTAVAFEILAAANSSGGATDGAGSDSDNDNAAAAATAAATDADATTQDVDDATTKSSGGAAPICYFAVSHSIVAPTSTSYYNYSSRDELFPSLLSITDKEVSYAQLEEMIMDEVRYALRPVRVKVPPPVPPRVKAGGNSTAEVNMTRPMSVEFPEGTVAAAAEGEAVGAMDIAADCDAAAQTTIEEIDVDMDASTDTMNRDLNRALRTPLSDTKDSSNADDDNGGSDGDDGGDGGGGGENPIAQRSATSTIRSISIGKYSSTLLEPTMSAAEIGEKLTQTVSSSTSYSSSTHILCVEWENEESFAVDSDTTAADGDSLYGDNDDTTANGNAVGDAAVAEAAVKTEDTLAVAKKNEDDDDDDADDDDVAAVATTEEKFALSKTAAVSIVDDASVEADFAEEDNNTLEKCLELFMRREQLGQDDPWFCSACKDLRRAYKKFDIWSLPELLVIHLKRFNYGSNRYMRQKIDTLIRYPVRGLNMRPYVLNGQKHANSMEESQKNKKAKTHSGSDSTAATSSSSTAAASGGGGARSSPPPPTSSTTAAAAAASSSGDKRASSEASEDGDDDDFIYDLYAVTNHFGGMGGGHYIAHALHHEIGEGAKTKEEGKWFKFDDSMVSESNEDAAQSESAYVLFYKKRSSDLINTMN